MRLLDPLFNASMIFIVDISILIFQYVDNILRYSRIQYSRKGYDNSVNLLLLGKEKLGEEKLEDT